MRGIVSFFSVLGIARRKRCNRTQDWKSPLQKICGDLAGQAEVLISHKIFGMKVI